MSLATLFAPHERESLYSGANSAIWHSHHLAEHLAKRKTRGIGGQVLPFAAQTANAGRSREANPPATQVTFKRQDLPPSLPVSRVEDEISQPNRSTRWPALREG